MKETLRETYLKPTLIKKRLQYGTEDFMCTYEFKVSENINPKDIRIFIVHQEPGNLNEFMYS